MLALDLVFIQEQPQNNSREIEDHANMSILAGRTCLEND